MVVLSCGDTFYIIGAILSFAVLFYLAYKSIIIIKDYPSVRKDCTLMALYISINLQLLFLGITFILFIVNDSDDPTLIDVLGNCSCDVAVCTVLIRTVELLGKFDFYKLGRKILLVAFCILLGVLIASNVYIMFNPSEKGLRLISVSKSFE